jgi:hypothetical protein
MGTLPNQIPTCEISFIGDAETEANEIKNVLAGAGAAVTPPRSISRQDAELGAEEIILTIVLSAAAKAVIGVGLEHLKTYLINRVKKGKEVNPEASVPHSVEKTQLQVVLKGESKQVFDRKFLDFKVATVESVCKFIGSLSDGVLKHLGA